MIPAPQIAARDAHSTTAIEISRLSKWYGALQVLFDVDLHVEKGERLVICGPSGSGKSTLIRTVNALEGFQRGEIRVGGVDRKSVV